MEENTIRVYVQVDSNNVVIDINSSIFIQDVTDYIKTYEGNGDKYAHAQGSYLEKGLMDSNGKYNYKLVEGKVIELTDEEKATLFQTQAIPKTDLELLKETIDALVLANLGV